MFHVSSALPGLAHTQQQDTVFIDTFHPLLSLSFSSSFFIMANFIYQLDWALCPAICSNVILDVSVTVFLEEISVKTSGLGIK